MSKMRLGMHEEKWNIWNGTQAWGSSTRHDTVHRAWSQAQGMTQHTIHKTTQNNTQGG